jgi:hypothetical protein
MTDEGAIRGGIQRPEAIGHADWHRAELMADGLLALPIESQRDDVQVAYRVLLNQRLRIREARLRVQSV